MRSLILILYSILPFLSFGQSLCPRAESPENIVSPTSVVGNGTAASCTQAALQAALNVGGQIVCDCGPDPKVILLSTSLTVSQNTVLDGGNLLTLDGNQQVRIIYKNNGVDFTIQRTRLINGLAPGPSGHFSEECGGAILAKGGGTLKVLDCVLEGNSVVSTDRSDIAGGGVYVFGEIRAIFSGSTFLDNSASNGGAIGGLGSDIIVANCRFYRNAALGHTGGLRGHGGAINLDGVELAAADKLFSVCGSEFIENNGYAQGGATNTVFSDNVGAKLEIDQSYFEGNYLRASDAGNGGAIFHVVDDLAGGYGETQFTVTRSTFFQNHSDRHGGGLWALINGRGVIENCTFFRDSTYHPGHGLGGAATIAVRTENQGGWLVRNNSFVENYAGLFGGGVFSGPDAPTTWQNNVLLDNGHSNSNEYVNLNVNRTMDVQLGTNIQWPQYRPNGSEDIKATTSSIYASANAEKKLFYQGGPTPTLALPSSGPALAVGTGCPTTDQRLGVRANPCDLGSFEYGALALPSSVFIEGIQIGHKSFLSSGAISSSAQILAGASFTLQDASETLLLPGFSIAIGSELLVD